MSENTELTPMHHFELAQRQARAFAESSLVNNEMKTQANCLAAIMMADEMGESRLAVLQNIFFVHGRPGWITSFMVGRANRSGKFKGPLRWRTVQKDDENIVVECYADLSEGGSNPAVTLQIDHKTAIESGWTTYKDAKDHYKEKTHPRWATPTMVEQMLRWRTASWLIRLYAPEVMMGLPTRDELEDASDREMVDVTPPAAPKLEEFTKPLPQPARQDHPASREPSPEEGDPDVPLYTLTNCDGEPFECSGDVVEEEMLHIFDEAKTRDDAAIEAALVNNEGLLAEFRSARLAHEFTVLRAYLARAKDNPKPAEVDAPEPAKRHRATKVEMEERRRVRSELSSAHHDNLEQDAHIAHVQADPEQHPADGPPARSPAGALSDDLAVLQPSPSSLGEAETRTQPSPPPGNASSLIVPMRYERDGETPAYRLWWVGALFNALRKDSREWADLRLAANGEMIQAYFRTISSPARERALAERDEILRGLK